MNDDRRRALLARIEEDIRLHTMHVQLVKSRQVPRFAYTIGLLERGGVELVLAGAANLTDGEVKAVLDLCADRASPGRRVDAGTLGEFVLASTTSSWREPLLLGAAKRYGAARLDALQVVPLGRRTVDVPDMSVERTEVGSPAWRYLSRPWDLPIPDTARVITNLAALFGAPVTEVVRWEEDSFEAFAGAGPDVSAADLRVVPLSTMLAADPSLGELLALPTGKGLWRTSSGAPWVAWGEHVA